MKLFWKEVREDMIPVSVGRTVWDELPDAQVDTQKLEHLFESRAKDLISKVRIAYLICRFFLVLKFVAFQAFGGKQEKNWWRGFCILN